VCGRDIHHQLAFETPGSSPRDGMPELSRDT
jgi:hypothetical protein